MTEHDGPTGIGQATTRTSIPFGLVGQTVSHYTITDKIGEGGMGVVYKARDSKLNRTVALKFLPAVDQDDADLRRRLAQEARAASALDHPNIVVIYDIDSMSDGTMFVAMAFHEGETLQRRIREGLTISQGVDLARQIALGLAKAHAHGIIHRDIKPSNVIVSNDGVARIIDFGLAKPLDVTATVDGAVRGTPLYMSPEQISGAPIDPRTDLWSLGVVLYEMLAGQPPFRADSVVQMTHAVRSADPPPLQALRPGVPDALNRIVLKALEKDREDRYPCADAMAADLSAVAASLTVSAAVQPAASPRRRAAAIALAAAAVVAIGLGAWGITRYEHREWARTSAPKDVAVLQDQDRPLAALTLLYKALGYQPDDPVLNRLHKSSTGVAAITSTPAGATVEVADYVAPNGPWRTLGATPIAHVTVPKGFFRWRITKAGIGTYEVAQAAGKQMAFPLDEVARETDGMLPVQAGNFGGIFGTLGDLSPRPVPAHDIDKYEVTNRQFQAFVDAGGYTNQSFWTQPFIEGSRTLSWQDAMARFRDQSGRPGPSTWQAGHYADGQAEYPVSGVSWYEAAAYEAFAGKSLPVVAQWMHDRGGNDLLVERMSNIGGGGHLAPVGQFASLNRYGAYDMAGNAREWCWNAVRGDDRHFILGGSWGSPSYLYNTPEALPGFDRSAGNGFRGVRNHGALPATITDPWEIFTRDYSKVVPISDDTFRAYKEIYSYAPRPLNTTNDAATQTADWRREKVTFDAAYGDERVPAFVFLPTRVKPPYQTVVFFPSADVEFVDSSDTLVDMPFVDYVIQSGRAVIYPIYQATYERRHGQVRADGFASAERGDTRAVMIQRTQDVRRAIDYLATRPDIDTHKLGYLGVSMGSAFGVVTAAIESRLSVIVWLDGGLFSRPPWPGSDQAEFAPRVTLPVLMMNGKYDYVFPPETSQDPLFRLLGTPAADKHHALLDTAHDISDARSDMVREVLAWLDKYLGRVGG